MVTNKLDYQPLHDEVQFCCSDVDENSTEPNLLNVFSASNPSGDIQTNIMLKESAL